MDELTKSQMLTFKDIDFFLSYQFLYKESIINEGYIKNQNLKNSTRTIENKDINLYIAHIDSLLVKTIKKSLLGKTSIGLLFSGGLDSFLLLYYIRKIYPDIKIYTFTFLPSTSYDDDKGLSIENVANLFGAIHTNIKKEISYNDILHGLITIYSLDFELMGDEGMIYNYLFYQEISKIYKGIDFISGDGLDVLFGGLSMYRLSYMERLYKNKKEIFSFKNNYESEYFFKKINKYDTDFFYKYGEFFGGSFLRTNHIDKFYNLFSRIKASTILKKQIIFNSFFLITNRRNYLRYSAIPHGFNIITPFISENFMSKVLRMNIPDKFLINQMDGKWILRELGKKIKQENNIDFIFHSQFHIKYSILYQNNKEKILLIAKKLYEKGYISSNHYKLVPYFIKYSMWHENRMRIYLLLNLYCFLEKNIKL